MMRIISFDVGIKNMAYCFMEVGIDPSSVAFPLSGPIPRPSVKILQWNTLNLSGDEEVQHHCTCITGITKKLPQGKICGKKAKYGVPDTVFPKEKYCQKHATSASASSAHTKWILPKKETTVAELKKKKLEELAMEWKKIQIQTLGQTNGCSIVLRKQELVEHLAKYYAEREFTVLPIAKKRKAGEINLIEIGQNIRTQLDTHLGNLSLDCVIIENQISTIATRMKTIQGMLAQYFIMRKNGDCEKQPYIEFISSHNKLKGFSLEHSGEPNQEGDKKKYKANKMNGVDVCRRFLCDGVNPDLGENWKEEFEKNGKKDDLADGFLQCIFYLKREKIITYAENLKINIV